MAPTPTAEGCLRPRPAIEVEAGPQRSSEEQVRAFPSELSSASRSVSDWRKSARNLAAETQGLRAGRRSAPRRNFCPAILQPGAGARAAQSKASWSPRLGSSAVRAKSSNQRSSSSLR